MLNITIDKVRHIEDKDANDTRNACRITART